MSEIAHDAVDRSRGSVPSLRRIRSIFILLSKS